MLRAIYEDQNLIQILKVVLNNSHKFNENILIIILYCKKNKNNIKVKYEFKKCQKIYSNKVDIFFYFLLLLRLHIIMILSN